MVAHVRSQTTGWLAIIAYVAFELFAGEALVHAETKSQPSNVVLRGKVRPLIEVLKQFNPDLKADPESSVRTVVLVCEDNVVVPLISDEASRALLKDSRLQNRPVEIHARQWTGLPYVQVINVKVEEDGKLRTPEYFCHVCTISLRYPQDCPCCQGPMEFRMKPESP